MRILIKYGGAAQTDPALAERFYRVVAGLRREGHEILLVHGGGPFIAELLTRLGLPSAFLEGLRVTDDATMEVVEMVLSGRINKEIVVGLEREGVPAVGISGRDGPTLLASPVREPAGVGRVGEVRQTDGRLPLALLKAGYLPVVSPVGQGEDGGALNLNADVAAGALAQAVAAEILVFLTDVPGLLVDGRVVPVVTPAEAEEFIRQGIAVGGMIPKLRAGIRAASVVGRVLIADGREPESLRRLPVEDIGTRMAGAGRRTWIQKGGGAGSGRLR